MHSTLKRLAVVTMVLDGVMVNGDCVVRKQVERKKSLESRAVSATWRHREAGGEREMGKQDGSW